MTKDRAMFRNRALGAAALLAWASGCAPSIPQSPPPASIVAAVFDPTAGDIPLPNDLALQGLPSPLLSGAQNELLEAFAAQGGFPSDQEVAITVSFARDVPQADGSITREAPDLDFATFNPGTFFVYAVTSQQSGFVPVEAPSAADYRKVSLGSGQKGVLTIHREGRAPWEPGRYVMALRGGDNGVRTAAGEPVNPSAIFFLVAQGEDLSTEKNIGLLRTQTGSVEGAKAAAQRLNQIIAAYKQGAFQAVDQVFPHQELASLTTFTIAPRVTQVDLDPGRGLVPLPIDLLRDPRAPSATCPACGRLTPVAACTLSGGELGPNGCVDKHGNPNAAAAGFATLDGFSTTAAILAPTNDLIQASTVTADTVRLYDLSGASPALVDPKALAYEPSEVTSDPKGVTATTLSPTIALQPAGATAGQPTSVFTTRPLKENTHYAVLITKGVKDKTGAPLGIGTVGRILLFSNAVVDQDQKSQLAGIDDATAGALEVMRQRLAPVIAASGIPKNDLAMAYTFKTQSFLGTAAQLAAMPYLLPAETAQPGPVTALSATEAFKKYGVDLNKVDSEDIGEVLETTLTTFNLLDLQTGAFNPDPTKAAPETLKVLIITPKATNAAVPTCDGALAGLAPAKCAPMVVFRHGLGRGRADALLVGDHFAKAGLVTVAIDAAKHGDRSFCGVGDVTVTLSGAAIPVCADGAACVALATPAGLQGDTKAPGTCAKGFTKMPVGCTPQDCPEATDGIPVVSSNFLVSANFFRTRDTLRQDIIDQSQLVRAIAFAPPAGYSGGHKVFDAMAAGALVIDPTQIFFAGQSLGAIQGALDVAANPRISKAVLNVGGGTLVDIFTTSPAFAANTTQLLAGLGIAPGTSAYLKFLTVAKTILDPADPVNYLGHLSADTLPNLLPPLGGALDGSKPQSAKKVLDQIAFCDQTVPNPWQYVFAHTAGAEPLPVQPAFGGPGTFQLFFHGTGAPSASDLAACPAPGAADLPSSAVSHGFLTDWRSSPAMARKAQSDAAAFLVSDTNPNSLIVLP
jgi:hypothetical protein